MFDLRVLQVIELSSTIIAVDGHCCMLKIWTPLFSLTPLLINLSIYPIHNSQQSWTVFSLVWIEML